MAETKCPFCGCQNFYVKDPDDEYETYEFDMKEGTPANPNRRPVSEVPECTDETEAYCNKCAWHGKLQELKK